jgi:hypothetical protein
MAESIEDRLVPRCPFRDRAVRQPIRVDPLRAEMLQHFAHDALSGGYISGDSNDILARPGAHKPSIGG